MKLNLVADYELPNGKRHVGKFALHESNNLAGLREMSALAFPIMGGGWVRVCPSTILMCASARKAADVVTEWEHDYEAQGRLWDYKPIAVSEAAAVKEVA